MPVLYAGSAELVTLSNTFAVDGVATDPTTVTLTVVDPAGASTSYTYAGATITRTGAGAYSKDVACASAGRWQAVWTGTGTASDIVPVTWEVRDTARLAYASVAQLKARLGLADSNTGQDELIADALDSASLSIDRYCGRTFARDTAASARWFTPGLTGIEVDDFWTTAGLVVTPYLNNTAQTAWTLDTEFWVSPASGVRDGVPGWPYERLDYVYAYGGPAWPFATGGNRVQVAAQWGWAAVPRDVQSACLILAAAELKLKDAPFGIAGFGDYAVRINNNPAAEAKLRPYRRHAVLVAS
jgi:hypothetical protein